MSALDNHPGLLINPRTRASKPHLVFIASSPHFTHPGHLKSLFLISHFAIAFEKKRRVGNKPKTWLCVYQ
jgi:hypothetical protein